MLAISTQRQSKRYYKSRIPKSSSTRGCNHVQLNPHISMYKNKSATNARARKDSQRRRRDCPNDCRDSRQSHAPHIPGPDAAAHRCARRRVSTAPVTERLHASLADRPQHSPVRVNRTACEKLSQLNFKSLKVRSLAGLTLKRVNSTSVERTTPELQLCGAACMLPLRQPSLSESSCWAGPRFDL